MVLLPVAALPGHSTGSVGPILCLLTGAPSLMSDTEPQSCISLVSNQVSTSDKGFPMPLLVSAPSQPPIFSELGLGPPLLSTPGGCGSHFSLSESLSPRLFRVSLTGRVDTSVDFWLLGQQQEVLL